MPDIKRGQELLDAQVGKPYIFGKEVSLSNGNPSSFDCSELVEWAFFQLGLPVPDGSANQFEKSVPVEKPQPFDLGFLRKAGGAVHHVVIYYGGNDVIVHAKGEDYGVIKESASMWAKRNGAEFAGWRRPEVLT